MYVRGDACVQQLHKSQCVYVGDDGTKSIMTQGKEKEME